MFRRAAWPWPSFLLAILLVACGQSAADNEPASSTAGTTGATATATEPVPDATEPVDPTSSPAATTTGEPSGVAYPTLGAYTGVAHEKDDPSFEALPGASAYYGELGNATYRIEIPDQWNGDLVMWAHGFKGFGTQLDVDSPPRGLRELMIEQGFAWAASSYSENGYAPGIGADDTLTLREYFVDKYGPPGRVYLAGASMGGNVIALSLEHFPGAYDGALSICGALGGQTQIDYLVSWAHLAAFFAGVELPLEDGSLAVTLALTNRVSPALGSPDAPTDAGRRFTSAIRMLTGGPRPFFAQGFAEQYTLNFGYILSDPAAEGLTARAATNEETVYSIEPGLGVTADEVNAGIFRQAADPEVRDPAAYPDKVPTSGHLTVPLITLHNTGDLFVPISQEIEYRRRAEAAGAGGLLVQRAIRDAGHCQFSDQELSTAFLDLVGWVESGARPAGDDLLGDLSDVGMAFTDPVRPGDPGGR